MKNIISIFILFFYTNLVGQVLKNTEWIQVKVERKDGSRIVYHDESEISKTKYYFRQPTVLIAENNLYASELKYTVKDKILAIGEFTKYNIDTVDSEILVLTEIPKDELPDDKINRIILMNRNSIFNYITENNQLGITGDSLIDFNMQFAPTYYGNIDKLFTQEFIGQKDNKEILGAFVINPKGKIENIQLDNEKNFSKSDIEKIIKIISSTSGSWIIPVTPKPFYFRINFGLNFSYINPLSGIKFYFNAPSSKGYGSSLTIKQKSEADAYYNRGNDLFQNGKYNKASKQYLKCLQIDSLYIDAYYNLAFSYQKLGDSSMACETWNVLKQMGQKQGEYLYNQNCK